MLQPLLAVSSTGPKPQEPHHLSKRHMVPLGLMSGFQTHALGWRRQEVHHCANTFAGMPISLVLSPISALLSFFLKDVSAASPKLSNTGFGIKIGP